MIVKGPELEPYFIEVDSNNHTVFKTTDRVSKKGKPINEFNGYFSSLNGALIKIIKLKASDNLGDSSIAIQDLVTRIEKATQDVLSAKL